jgi:hypothetical protein
MRRFETKKRGPPIPPRLQQTGVPNQTPTVESLGDRSTPKPISPRNGRAVTPINSSQYAGQLDFWTLDETGNNDGTLGSPSHSETGSGLEKRLTHDVRFSSTNPFAKEVNWNLAKESTNPFLSAYEDPIHSTRYPRFPQQDAQNIHYTHNRLPNDVLIIQNEPQLTSNQDNLHARSPIHNQYHRYNHSRPPNDVLPIQNRLQFVSNQDNLHAQSPAHNQDNRYTHYRPPNDVQPLQNGSPFVSNQENQYEQFPDQTRPIFRGYPSPSRNSTGESRHRSTDVFRWKISFRGDQTGLSLNDFLSQAEDLSVSAGMTADDLRDTLIHLL